MPNFSFSMANKFLRFTPESLDEIEKRIADKRAKQAKALEEGKNEQHEEENIQPQLDLKTFKKLPLIYGKPPPWLIGEPLEDVDPYYRDCKTFMVLSSRRRIYRFTASRALFLFSPFHPLRRFAIKILIHSLFIAFITCVVLVNCVFMTLKSPPKNYNITEAVFTAVYTTEFVVKVVARGFILQEFTYMRDPWNILDFFVLIVTYVSLTCEFGSISALRIFRVLRTLKAVSVIPGLKVIITSLLLSVKKLANVMLLTIFCLAVFALVGLQLFMGNLRNKCVHRDFVNVTFNQKNQQCVLNDPVPVQENVSMYQMKDNSSEILLCGFSKNPNGTECGTNYFCTKHGKNPDYGYTSFDHFGWAFLSLFRLMTQDSWERLYRQVIRTSGKSYVIFFVIIIFLCSFYLFNLILAVVTMAYEEQNRATVAQTKARERLLQEAKKILKMEKEMSVQSHVASSDGNIEISSAASADEKEMESRREKRRGTKSKLYGEDEASFYSPPDKSQQKLKELLMSYHLPVDSNTDVLQRQKLTSAARVISRTMEWEEPKFEFPPGLKKAFKKYLIWQCCPFWLQIKARMKQIMINHFMELFITLCILVNTLLMALENCPLSKEVVSQGNIVFTAIFATEMVLKMIVLDPYYYFQDAWNIFDFVVVVMGIINLITQFHISFLRMLRIFKLSKFWPALNKLMKIMMKSVGPLSNLTLVLVFTVFIFAVVGKQAFGKSYEGLSQNCSMCFTDHVKRCEGDDTKCRLRWHMKDFFHSFLIIFRILCGEWIETMWGCMQAAGAGWCIALFMLVLVLGNLVVLNLFIALLLSSFSSSNLKMEPNEEDPRVVFVYIHRGFQFVKHLLWDRCCNRCMQKLKRAGTKNKGEAAAVQKASTMEPADIREDTCENQRNWKNLATGEKQEDVVPVWVPLAHLESLSEDEEYTSSDIQENIMRNRREVSKKSRQRLSSQIFDSTSASSLDVPKAADHEVSCSEASTVDQRSLPCPLLLIKKEPEDCFPQVKTDTFLGNMWWRCRKTCYKIIKHSWFEFFIIFMILLSSCALIFEDIHLEKKKTIKAILQYADKFFFFIFFLEMLLKWVAYGFKKYFTSGWCWLDFFIVCVVVNALTGAVPSIGNVLLVCIVLWLPFSILGMHMFGGKFRSCSTPAPGTNCTEWETINVNFDNVWMGYLALLQVATFKGWMGIMYAAVDAQHNDGLEPCFENNVAAYIYFVVFIIFGSFFMLNLFIGVVIDNFNQQRKKICDKLIFLSEEQKKYYNALKKLGAKKPHKTIPRPLNKYQGFCFDIISKQAFDLFIIALILLNVVIMAVEYEGQGPEAKHLLEKINFAFVGIFTGECIMKILALRLYYLKDNWNIFDFAVVILSIVSCAAEQFQRIFNVPPTILRIIRVARVSRLLRLIRGARGLRTLLFALLMSLPALTNIGLLLFLIMFIYAIFGMTNLACASWKSGIDDMFNFQTFGSSMLCLFQITTSAGWDELLYPMLSLNQTCAANLPARSPSGSCVNRGVAIAYFVTYIVISFLIVVNMYIAVIIENLNVATEESTEPLGEDDFDIFYDVWAKFDPQATQFISYLALSDFADSLTEPLRIPKPNKQQLMTMDLPMVDGNKIHCLDILFAFTKRVLGEAGEMDSLETEIEEKYPGKIFCQPIVTTPMRKQVEAAIVIQRAFRHYLQCSGGKVIQEAVGNSSLVLLPEEENASEFGLSENEDSLSITSLSQSSACIPPPYSKVTGTTDGIPNKDIH
ncbi:sodium channel protein type 5 subunit alpha-like [Varanus komodoensis]|uniref:sodium channel protein type 5 subunit alpha-like n=1 Tax=Varanus komodoensis TaxID=61221 RepID=UPI001CF77424|nr:sodium channel protein type 5 subunit alpha-like [Varanus komodoensis]